MPGLKYCEDCWYYNAEKKSCDAKRKSVSAKDFACTEFADKNEED